MEVFVKWKHIYLLFLFEKTQHLSHYAPNPAVLSLTI